MPTRRTATTMLAAGILLGLPATMMHPARAQAPQQAVIFIQGTADRLVAIANGTAPRGEKLRQLQLVIDSSVDVAAIARISLGRFWHSATPGQQRQYTALSRDFLVTKISDHIGDYQGVRCTTGAARVSEGSEIVITTVERPSLPANRVDWVVSTESGAPKIIDLLADGTSMRVTQASDFGAYMAHHQNNMDALIAGMREKVAQTK